MGGRSSLKFATRLYPAMPPAHSNDTVRYRPPCFVIGAQKAGTTSLFGWMSKHPEIAVHPSKELSFFSLPNYSHTVDGFFRCYGSSARRRICVDISTDYTKYPVVTGVPARLFHAFPDSPLVYIVRDPVRRAISHYHHQLIIGEERNYDVDNALRSDPRYRYYSLYYLQLEQYLRFFPPEKIIVISLERLLASPEHEWQRLLTHAGVRVIGATPDIRKAANKSADAPVITPLIRQLVSSRLYGRLRFSVPRVVRRRILRLLAGKRPPLSFPSDATIDWLRTEFVADSESLVRHCNWKENPWPW